MLIWTLSEGRLLLPGQSFKCMLSVSQGGAGPEMPMTRLNGNSHIWLSANDACSSPKTECCATCRAEGGSEAASLRVAEQYMAAFGNIAKQGNTMLIPASTNDPASFVAQALSVYKSVSQGGIGTSRYCQHGVSRAPAPCSECLHLSKPASKAA